MSNVRKWKRDGRRQIITDHAELNGVTPAILAWWYGHVVGDMEYAGRTYPHYLVWHPLDHISYEIEGITKRTKSNREHVCICVKHFNAIRTICWTCMSQLKGSIQKRRRLLSLCSA